MRSEYALSFSDKAAFTCWMSRSCSLTRLVFSNLRFWFVLLIFSSLEYMDWIWNSCSSITFFYFSFSFYKARSLSLRLISLDDTCPILFSRFWILSSATFRSDCLFEIYLERLTTSTSTEEMNSVSPMMVDSITFTDGSECILSTLLNLITISQNFLVKMSLVEDWRSRILWILVIAVFSMAPREEQRPLCLSVSNFELSQFLLNFSFSSLSFLNQSWRLKISLLSYCTFSNKVSDLLICSLWPYSPILTLAMASLSSYSRLDRAFLKP